jgi:hypothetical protein
LESVAWSVVKIVGAVEDEDDDEDEEELSSSLL